LGFAFIAVREEDKARQGSGNGIFVCAPGHDMKRGDILRPRNGDTVKLPATKLGYCRKHGQQTFVLLRAPWRYCCEVCKR
jgi:hypothetical protein